VAAVRNRLISVAVAAFLAATGLYVVVLRSAPPAAAAESGTVVTREIPREKPAKAILQLPTVHLTAGQPRFFYGRYAATSRYGLMMAAQIACTVDGKGYPSVTSTMNHRGATLEPFARVISVRWLFTPPRTGDYYCRLIGYSKTQSKDVPADAKLVVVPGDNTVFGMHDGPEPGALEWRDPADYRPSVGISHPTVYLFDRSTWSAAAGARQVDVRADVEVTADSTGGNRPFSPRLTLMATQLDAAGRGCAPTVTTQSDPGLEIVTHHYKVQLTMRVPVSTAQGCTRNFDAKVKMQYQPWPTGAYTRHGGHAEGGGYSNLILMNG
jgi:hypothetical protein